MLFTEQKIEDNKYNYKYFNEDLYGKTTILSKDKLEPDELDFIVNDLVMDRKLKKGHDDNRGFEFEAIFNSDWEDEEDINIEIDKHNKEQVERILSDKIIKEWRKKNIWRIYLLIITLILSLIYIIINR